MNGRFSGAVEGSLAILLSVLKEHEAFSAIDAAARSQEVANKLCTDHEVE